MKMKMNRTVQESNSPVSTILSYNLSDQKVLRNSDVREINHSFRTKTQLYVSVYSF